jgi:hypothetical protein
MKIAERKLLRSLRPHAQIHRRTPGRLYRVKCHHAIPGVIEVRIARTRRQMFEDIIGWHAPGEPVEPSTQGQVTSYYHKRGRRFIAGKMRPNYVVGRMFLNAQDLREKPSEIVSHECAHAAMAWVRLHRVDLSHMPGEEELCYAVGRLTRQVNRVCYAAKAFR